MATLNLEGRGAVYHRVSTDKQDADRQRQSTKDWLDRHKASVDSDCVYEDIGWTRAEADKRPAFQQMLRDAEDGKIKWIVADSPDRTAAKSKHAMISYLYRLQEAGCRLYTVDDVEWTADDLLTLIKASIEGEKSEGEGRSKSERVLEKARQLAKRGEWLGGRVPYGTEVVAFRLVEGELVEQWRWRMIGADRRLRIDILGNTKEFVGRNNTPPKEYDQILQLRPTTEGERLDAIKNIFRWFASESISAHAIAQRLNEQGAPAPVYSNRWGHNAVDDILRSSVYIGKPSWNRSTAGSYGEWRDGQRHQKKPGQPVRAHAKKDWIVPDEPIFEPVIDPKTWETVQKKLETRQPHKRGPKSPALWLSGLVFCAGCGKPMYGRIEKRTKRALYFCSTYFLSPKPRSKSSCTINRIEHDKLEELILRWLDDTGVDLSKITVEGKQRRKFPDSFFTATEKFIWSASAMRERLGLPDPPHVDLEVILNRFAEVYDQELPALEKRLKELREEQRLAIRSLSRLPDEATQAIAATKREIADLDQQIREVEAKTVDSGAKFRQAASDMMNAFQQWEAARDAMAYETSNRRKAEAVRRVLGKLILSFTPTGRKRPTAVLTDWEFIPVGANGEVSQLSQPSQPLPDSQSASASAGAMNYSRLSGCRCP